MMKSAVFSVVLVFFVASAKGQGPHGLRPEAIIAMSRHGAVLTYDIDVSKCDVKLPQTIPAYSYGDVMNDVYIEYGDEQNWRLYTTEERPVNMSRFHETNGGWRITELEFSPTSAEDGTAVITLTDVEQGGQGRVMASGTISCTMASGGFIVNVQRMGGRDIEREQELMMTFRQGEGLTFTVDLGMCTQEGQRTLLPGGRFPRYDNGSELWIGRISGYRVPGKVQAPAVEFTSVLMGPKQREVFNIRVQGENQVEIKAYAFSRTTHQPTPVVTYRCTLGAAGSFHVFHNQP